MLVKFIGNDSYESGGGIWFPRKGLCSLGRDFVCIEFMREASYAPEGDFVCSRGRLHSVISNFNLDLFIHESMLEDVRVYFEQTFRTYMEWYIKL